MKLILKTAALATAFTLAACGGGNTDNASNSSNGAGTELNNLDAAASTIENVAENATGNAADMLGNQVEAVENAAATLEHNATSTNAAH